MSDFLGVPAEASGPIDGNLCAPALTGARSILVSCLGLEANEAVAIVFDETTRDVSAVLNQAATALGIVVFPHFVSIAEQTAFAVPQRLPDAMLEDIGLARAVITCIAALPCAMPFRSTLVKTATTAGKRVAHMPGIDLETIGTSMSLDYAKTTRRCQELALILMLGEKAILTTYSDTPDHGHDLVLDLGGVMRPPITSTGIIPLGTWGNLPGGETFIAPIESNANGTFVLNGSFTGTVIAPPKYLTLHFSNGLLQEIEGDPDLRARLIKNFGRSWNPKRLEIAELGIGVNTGIKKLTGRCLIDEKCAGTVHIAVGDNARYGGTNHADIHEDLITRAPSLTINQKPILQRGRYVAEASLWYADISTLKALDYLKSPDSVLRRTLIRVEQNSQGGLQVLRRVVEERVCAYVLGDDQVNRLLWDIYRQIPQFPNVTTIGQLLASSSSEQVPGLLAALMDHKLIEVVHKGL